MQDYEKLGAFYLGRVHDLNQNKTTEDLLLYDSKDLTTHAVCVGMTGSGKTGLCLSLLEEAAIDGIPALVIDPKGDMTNLLLTFPELTPENFIPWINESDARKKALSVAEYAAKQAEMWESGLANWGQSGDRIKRLKESAEFFIYTPGSSAGIPISILKSFAAPPQEIINDSDVFKDRIASTATSLLGLIGIEADPIKSREHILISTILTHCWQQGKDLDLALLIQSIQSPPISKIGIFDLDAFYPSKDRFELAMLLNNLLASPTFQTWLEGVPLDINQLLYKKTGKPKVSIFYIAHLSDPERMFFVSLLLNQVLGWMRTQSGTTSLRAILYFDEIFGYIPPTANPPSKKPLLTLLKQARAFGLGLVLATQNPVDLDYKGLSNTGTWFIGRLQTERDRDRVLDGLMSASSGEKIDRKTLEGMISQLGKRVFLLHNVHEDAPEIFHTRWAMSYLRGPLTRTQIKYLMEEKQAEEESSISAPSIKLSSQEGAGIQQHSTLAPEIPQLFMPIRSSKPESAHLLYRPYVWGSADLQFIDKAKGVDLQKTVRMISPVEDSAIPVTWENAITVDVDEAELLKTAEETAGYQSAPGPANQSKNYKDWENDFKTHIYRTEKIELFKSPTFNETSLPDKSERDFRIRLSQIAREQRDEWTEKLRQKYAKKTASLETKIRSAEERLEREQEQSKQQKLQTAISFGTTILGAFLGRKAISRSTISKAGTAMRSASRTIKEAGDIQRARENLELLQEQLKDLENEFKEEIQAYEDKFDVLQEEFETISIRPLKSNISVKLFSFIWVPFWEIEGKPPTVA